MLNSIHLIFFAHDPDITDIVDNVMLGNETNSKEAIQIPYLVTHLDKQPNAISNEEII